MGPLGLLENGSLCNAERNGYEQTKGLEIDVALKAMQTRATVADLAVRRQVYRNQINARKKQLAGETERVLESGGAQEV